MTPFIFDKIRHKRTQNPPIYIDYHKYKPHLCIEFNAQCIYCREPDFFKGYNEFGVEHYNPDKKYKLDYSNLFYSCNNCNRLKRKFWPDIEQTKKLIFIPNPCDHIMFEHMQFVNEEILSKTNAGKYAIELLKLNSSERIKFRATINYNIKKLIDLYYEYQKALQKIESKLKLFDKMSIFTKFKVKSLIKEKRNTEEEINQIKNSLSNYLSIPVSNLKI